MSQYLQIFDSVFSKKLLKSIADRLYLFKSIISSGYHSTPPRRYLPDLREFPGILQPDNDTPFHLTT